MRTTHQGEGGGKGGREMGEGEQGERGERMTLLPHCSPPPSHCPLSFSAHSSYVSKRIIALRVQTFLNRERSEGGVRKE